MDINQLLQSHPRFHTDEHGQPVSWAIGDDVLEFIFSQAIGRARTAETGAGLTTVAFALAGTEHTTISPDGDEIGRVQAFCQAENISLARVSLEVGRSEFVLPQLNLGPLDLFLIDGRHGFPTPFIDWFYGASALRVGGLMIVDDTQLRTGAILRDFLAADPCWRTTRFFDKTAAFEKLQEGVHNAEWNNQPWCLESVCTSQPGRDGVADP